jgi:hypothetical protein
MDRLVRRTLFVDNGKIYHADEYANGMKTVSLAASERIEIEFAGDGISIATWTEHLSDPIDGRRSRLSAMKAWAERDNESARPENVRSA